MNLQFKIAGKLKFAILTILVNLIIYPVFSIENDSTIILLKKLQYSKNDSARVNLLNKISLSYLESDIDESLIYARKALNLSNILDYKPGIAQANCNLGNIFAEQNKFQPAINYFLISVKIFKELHLDKNIARTYNRLGYIHLIQSDYSQALDAFFKSLIYSTGISDDYQIAFSFHYIGNVYFNQKKYELANDYYLQALELRKKIIDKKGMAGSYNNIGEIFRVQKKLDQAFKFYQKAVEINKEINNLNWLSINYQNIGSLFQDQKDYEKAISYFQTSLEICIKMKNKQGMASIYNSIGNYYLMMNRNIRAIDYFNMSLKISKEIKLVAEIITSNKGLSDAYRNLNNYKRSLEFYHEYSFLNDSVRDMEKEMQLSKMQKSYDLQISESQNILKDNEIELLERNKKINQLQMTILIAGLLLIVVLGIIGISWQKNKNKKERELFNKNKEIHETHKELMSSTINNKNNELINFALHIGQKNEFIQAIKTDIKNISNKDEDDKLKLIKSLIFKINQNLRVNRELEEFQKDVDKVNRDFFNKLISKYPNLTKNEKQLSALLRLNLSSKEIASLNNISTKAVEMSRYRLRKKLGLTANTCLTDFLENI